MKPIRTTVIVIAIIAVLAAGFYFLLKTEPKDETDAAPSFTPTPTITLFKTEKENIAAIKITSEGSSYTVSKGGDGKWVVNNDPAIKISQSKADTLAYECSSITVKQLVKENVTDFAPYGLNDPYARVEISLTDGAMQNVLIGALTADGSLRYIMLEGEDKVYAKSASGADSLALKLEKLRDASLYSVNAEEITAITMEKQDSHKIVLVKEEQSTEEGEEPVYLWKMKEPLVKEISNYNLSENVLQTIPALSFDSVAADSASDLGQYGLDTPFATYSVSDAENTYTVLVGNENNGSRYVKMPDSPTIYLVSNSKLEFLNVGYLQLVDKLIYLENIEGVTGVSVSGEGQNFELQIEGSGESAGYKINGTPLSEEAFKNAYQVVLGITLDDFTTPGTKPSGEAAATIIYHKKDGSDAKVAFYEWDERNYLVHVNGEGNLICRKKQVSNMLDKLAQAASQ